LWGGGWQYSVDWDEWAWSLSVGLTIHCALPGRRTDFFSLAATPPPEAFRRDYGALVTRGASAEATSGRTPGARSCQDALGTLY
jgi:hypothetical protein